MRITTSQGMFFFGQELGIIDTDIDKLVFGDRRNTIAVNRGYYFDKAQDLLNNKYSNDINQGMMSKS